MYSRGATQIDGNAAQLVSLTRKTAQATFRSPMQARRRVHRSRTGLHQTACSLQSTGPITDSFSMPTLFEFSLL